MANSFTDKQKKFIQAYVQCLNATQAAKDAGYACKNDPTFAQTGAENLRKPYIRAEIDRILKENTISPDELVGRISDHATGSMGDFVTFTDDFGIRLDLEKAEQLGRLHLIKKFKETESKRVDKDGNEFISLRREVELYDASAAQDKLMRFHSMYKDKSEVKHTNQIKFIDYGLDSPDDDSDDSTD